MNNSINVLFFDDSQPNVELIVAEFKMQGFNIEYKQADTCADVLDRLKKNSCDLIVSKNKLAGTSVMELLGMLSEKSLEIPLIVISDTYNENDMVKIIKAGGRDYISQD